MALPLIPLLTLGAQVIGGIMGNQTSGSATTNENSLTTSQQGTAITANQKSNENTQQNTSQTSNQSSNSTGMTHDTSGVKSSQTTVGRTTEDTTTSSSASSQTQQQQNQTQQQTGTSQENLLGSVMESVLGTQVSDISRLDDATKSLLTSSVQQLLNTTGASTAAINSAISEIGNAQNFDVDSFVNGVMQSANSVALDNLQTSTNNMNSSIGASSRSNSAAALLENKMKNQTAANLAGIRADAQARGAEIQGGQMRDKSQTIANLTSSQQGGLASMLGTLIQAGEKSSQTMTQTGDTKTQQQQTGTTQQNLTGTTTGTSSTQEQANSKSSTVGTSMSTTTGESFTDNRGFSNTGSTVTGNTNSSTTGQTTSETQQQQNQVQTGAQQVDSTSNKTAQEKNNDWTKLAGGIGNMFNATF